MDRTITGTPGDDTLVGGADDEEIKGLAGDDTLTGGDGDDVLIGNEGDDVLRGGRGADRLFGCEDDDILDGGAGADLLNAGSGRDTLIFRASENTGPAFDFYDGHNGIDRLVLILTAAEFAAAEAEIAQFQTFIDATTGPSGESGGRTTSETGSDGAGAFFFFGSLGLAARRIERLQVIVDDEVVIGADPLAVDDAVSVAADAEIAGSVADNDAVGDDVTYTLLSGPENGAFTFAADGGFTFAPDAETFLSLGLGETATRSFTYRVADRFGETSDAVATITIVGVNDPVDAGEDIAATRGDTDASFTLDLLQGASDPDGSDVLSVASVVTVSGDDAGIGEPDGDGVITIDPTAYDALVEGETETIVLRVTIADGNGSTDTRDVTLLIEGSGGNQAPVVSTALQGEFAEDEAFAGDTAFALDLLSGVSDPDGDALSIRDVEIDGFLSGDIAASVEGSTLVIPTDQAAFQGLAEGETVTISVSYIIDDGQGETVQRDGTITVTGTNDAPESSIAESASEDAAAFTVDLLGGATDIDGDTLFIVDGSVNAKPLKAMRTFIAEGTSVPNMFTVEDGVARVDLERFQYLAVGETETITISYQISDGIATVPVTAVLTVVGANDAPSVAGPLAFTVNEDEAQDGRLLDLLRGAADIDRSDVLSVAELAGEGEGVMQQGNALRIDAAAFAGLDEGDTRDVTVQYLVSDGNGGQVAQSAVITLQGRGGNSASDDTAVVDVGAVVSGDVSANDDVVAGTTFTVETDVSRGTLVLQPDGGFTFDPGTDFSLANGETSVESFTYRFTTPAGDTGTAGVQITVTGTNTVPQINGSFGSGGENTAREQAILPLLPEDPDGPGPLTLSNFVITDSLGTTNIPSSALRVENGNFIYDGQFYDFLNQDEAVTVTLSFDVSDGLDTATSTLTLLIQGVEDTPELIDDAPIAVSIGEGDAPIDLTRLVLDNVTDPDQGDTDLLLITQVTGNTTTLPPAGTSLDGGVLSFDPSSYAAGLGAGETLTVQLAAIVDDDFSAGGANSTAAQIINITIVGAADPEPANSPPDVPALTATFAEDELFTPDGGVADTVFVLNLLAGASDPDGDMLSVTGPVAVAYSDLRPGETLDVTIAGDQSIIPTDQALFQRLGVGESATITLTYDVTDGINPPVERTATITVEGTNDAPVQLEPVVDQFAEDEALPGGVFVLSLDDLIIDPDENVEAFSISDVVLSDDAGLGGVEFTVEGSEIFIATSQAAFQALGLGESIDLGFTFSIADGDGGMATGEAVVTVDGANDAPVQTAPLSAGFMEGEFFEVENEDGDSVFRLALDADVTDVDRTDSVVTVSEVTLVDAQGLTEVAFAMSGDTLTIDTTQAAFDVLGAGETAQLSFSFTLADENGGTSTGLATVTVTGVNDAPTTNGGPTLQALTEDDGTLTLDLLGPATDVDDDDSELTLGDVAAVLTFTGRPVPETAVVSFEPLPDGRLEFDTTQAAFQSLAEGEEATLEITYEVRDPDGASAVQVISTTVTGVNDAPVSSGPIEITLDESDAALTIDVLQNASDIDFGDVLSFQGIFFPVSGDTSGLISSFDFLQIDPSAYTALEDGQTAVIVIDAEIADSNGGTGLQRITITINGQSEAENQPPGNFTDGVTLGGEFLADEGSTDVLTDLITNSVSDPDGGPITFASLLQPLPAGITLDPFTLEVSFDASDPAFDSLREGQELVGEYVIEVQDADGGLTDVRGQYAVIGTNDAPVVAAPLTFTLSPFSSSGDFVDLLEGASDVDEGDVLRIANLEGLPDGAFFLDETSGDLFIDGFDLLRPLAAGEETTFNVTYDIIDAFGGSVTQTLTINATGQNDFPFIRDVPEIWLSAFIEMAAESKDDTGHLRMVSVVAADPDTRVIDLSQFAFDPDGDPLSVVSVTVPAILDSFTSFDPATGLLSIDTAELTIDAEQSVTITYRVEDPSGAQAEGSLTVNLFDLEAETTDNPVTDGDLVLSFSEDAVPDTVDLFQGITDSDGTLVIEYVSGVSPFFVDKDTGVFRITDPFVLGPDFQALNAGESFVYSFTYSVADQRGGHVLRNAEITIEGVNDAPEDNLENFVLEVRPSQGIVMFDLAQEVDDPDDDAFTFTLASGTDPAFAIINEQYLRFDTLDSTFNRFAALAEGETRDFELSVSYTDSGGLTGTTLVTFRVVGENDAPVSVAPARFFDNSVENYQTSGGQQGFRIEGYEVFQDADNGRFDEVFTSVTLVSGDIPVAFEVQNGTLVIDPTSFAEMVSGQRFDFTFSYEGVTGDGDVFTGTFDYRVEGTGNGVAEQPGAEAKADDTVVVYEPGGVDGGVVGRVPVAVELDALDGSLSDGAMPEGAPNDMGALYALLYGPYGLAMPEGMSPFAEDAA